MTVVKDRIDVFIKSRKSDNTNDYAKSILKALIEANTEMRSVNLLKSLVPYQIPDPSTYFRIIKDMAASEIIVSRIDYNHKGGGRPPVYYSAPGVSETDLLRFEPKQDLYKIIEELQAENEMLRKQLANKKR